jgi:RimJ/RimL family protein N-acetyltransferase
VILYYDTPAIARWVASRIPELGEGADFGPCQAIGVARAGELAAGVVFHRYEPDFGRMEFTLAASSPRWASRKAVAELLRYPFQQVGVFTLWAAIRAGNARSLKLADGLGFAREATLRHYFGPDEPAVIVSMTQPEWAARFEKAH